MDKIIDKIYDLYVLNTNKYLIQKPGGEYSTITYKKRNTVGARPLLPYIIQQHLNQKKTVGIFAGSYYTKFICFDVDFKNKEMAKWIVYKITNTLRELGLKIGDYHISNSGGKGYHIEIFIDDLIPVTTAKRFFNLVINKAEVFGFDGEVEFRPTNTQGVKLPLGLNQKHYKTGGYCGFCDEFNGLNEYELDEEIEYFLSIKKIKRVVINSIINNDEENKKLNQMEKQIKERSKSTNLKKEIQDTEEVVVQHKELSIYNPTEIFSIKQISKLYDNGLSRIGTRHNACLNLAKFFKYNGLKKEKSEQLLIEWLKKQDKKYYSTPIDEAIKDIKEIIEYVFTHDYSLVPPKKDIDISFNEINQIILQCPEKNQKLLVYSMLIHSKRFANKDDVFYMTFNQMEEVSGLTRMTCINQINKLEKLGAIEVVERNGNNYIYDKELGKPMSKPNKYRITLNIEESKNEITYISKFDKDGIDDFKSCINNYYRKEDIKKLLPRKQFEYLYQ